MKTIYVVEHSCGWGPYEVSYHETLEGARKQFDRYGKELRKKEDYVRRTWKEKDGKVLSTDKTIYRATFQMYKESNNESGRECWEEDEYLEIKEYPLDV